MKILFVGETWNGSSARSLREALATLPDVAIDDVGEDHYVPRGKSPVVRGANRLLRHWYRRELVSVVQDKMAAIQPDVLMVYKGAQVPATLLRESKRAGVLVVNVFPDWSPHAYGRALADTMGQYDLVISTKPFHPPLWKSVYGYDNDCVCVPHGYDPAVHFWPDAPGEQDIDVVLASTWRVQYQALMQGLAASFRGQELSVAIMGHGWQAHASELPAHWQLVPGVTGRGYGEWLRRGRIAIAPVNLESDIGGVRHPGDQDTTRTYELAAMGCFFLHRRTPFVQTIYDESTEVPMWNDAQEMAALVRHYLPLEEERRAMAARAHLRAVPACSIPNRAQQVLEHVQAALDRRQRTHK